MAKNVIVRHLWMVLLVFSFSKTYSQSEPQKLNAIKSGSIADNNSFVPSSDLVFKAQNSKLAGMLLFDLTSIPEGTKLESAQLYYYLNYFPSGTSDSYFYTIPGDPDQVTVTFTMATSGKFYLGPYMFEYGANVVELNDDFIADFENKVGLENIAFSLYPGPSDSKVHEFFEANSSDPFMPYLLLTFETVPSQAPAAKFSNDKNEVVVGEEIKFTDTSSNSPTSWLWDFDVDNNPGSITSDVQNPTISFNSAGIYSVKLTSSNSFGSSSKVKPGLISVYNVPEAAFEIEELSERAYKFQDSSKNLPQSYRWTLGDGSPDKIQPSPIHQYEDDGAYEVCLYVENIAGKDTFCKNLLVGVNSVNNKSSDIKIYPNPLLDWLYLDIPMNSAKRLDIYNLLGSNIFSIELNMGRNEINLSSFPQGLYVIKLSKSSETIVQKKVILSPR